MKETTSLCVKRARIPKRLAPYFQEYDFKKLDSARDAEIVIQRALEFGPMRELQWLFRVYGKARIKQFVYDFGKRGLSPRAFNYWRRLFELKHWRRASFEGMNWERAQIEQEIRNQLWPFGDAN